MVWLQRGGSLCACRGLQPRLAGMHMFTPHNHSNHSPLHLSQMIRAIKAAVTIPVMAKARIGHFVEAQILEAVGIDYIDESEVGAVHWDEVLIVLPAWFLWVCGCSVAGRRWALAASGGSKVGACCSAVVGLVVMFGTSAAAKCCCVAPWIRRAQLSLTHTHDTRTHSYHLLSQRHPQVLTPADDVHHINKHAFKVPFVCGCRDLGEALRRIAEGAAMIRTKVGRGGQTLLLSVLRSGAGVPGVEAHAAATAACCAAALPARHTVVRSPAVGRPSNDYRRARRALATWLRRCATRARCRAPSASCRPWTTTSCTCTPR